MPGDEQKHAESNNLPNNIDQEEEVSALSQVIIACAHCEDLSGLRVRKKAVSQ